MADGVGMDEEAPGIDDQQPFQYLVVRLGPRVPGNAVKESEGVQDDVRDLAIPQLVERDRDGEDPRSDAVTEKRQRAILDLHSNRIDRGGDVLARRLLHRECRYQRSEER